MKVWMTPCIDIISHTGKEKRIFFLGAQPGDKNFLQTNGVFLH
jgi:hypothetical protein